MKKITVAFHSKPQNLDEVLNSNHYMCDAIEVSVKQEIVMSKEEYAAFTSDFYASNKFLANNQLGCFEVFWFHNGDKKGIVVDNQGYDYARYVGLVQ